MPELTSYLFVKSANEFTITNWLEKSDNNKLSIPRYSEQDTNPDNKESTRFSKIFTQYELDSLDTEFNK